MSRLVRAEFIKLFSHPFLYVALLILAGVTVLAEFLIPILRNQKETLWRELNAFTLFSYGFHFGLYVATAILLVFSCMMFAGEFDRGTIKNLLTRPITRTDFFVSKSVTIFALALLLYLFLVYVALSFALLRGDLGPVWDNEQFYMHREYSEIAYHARKAVLISFLPFLAIGFMGILVSNWTESSGYAVAIGLVLFIFVAVVTDMMTERTKQRIFLYYPLYALGKFQEYAEGGRTRWNEDIDKARLYVTVPLAYMAAFIPLAFGIFKARNIRV